MSNAPQRRMGSPAGVARTSPPGSSTTSPHIMLPGPANPFAIAPAGRAPTLSAPLPQLGSRSPSVYNPPYNHPYAASNSPSTASGSFQESHLNDGPSLSSAGVSPSQISSSALNAQKRAYRQRRKDPSCDACRERKVKCDATETSACSECSSRNHKCQFTKETNRRMSSIKQVQDLQSQLAELRQENTHLRTRTSDRSSMEIDRVQTPNHRPEPPALSPNTMQRLQPPPLRNFDSVRRNIQIHSQGVFDVHPQLIPATSLDPPRNSIPELPPRADFARISRSYLDSIHEVYPILHWPTFQHEVDRVYQSKSFHGMEREWIGLFFAVLACGALRSSTAVFNPSSGEKAPAYFDVASQALTHPLQTTSVASTKLALLLSIYASESNMNNVSSSWLALAVRSAQTLGLHLEVGRSAIEGEMQRRLWWSIYTWERICSLGANLPMLINEDDCDLSLPVSLEDRYITPQGFARAQSVQPTFTGLLAMIHVVRPYASVYQAMKASYITPQVIQHFDEQFMLSLPESHRTTSDASLEIAALLPLLTLQSARFLLYRRNMSTICRPPERADASRRCCSVAQDTAKYISRTLQSSPERPGSNSWQTKAAKITSSQLCLHLWRCILIACFRVDYDAALLCLHLLITAGPQSKIGVGCGRNLTFFLDRLAERIRSGNGNVHQLEHDEEMLAYVSGDMQGNHAHAWVWVGTDATDQTSPLSPQDRSIQARIGTDEHMHGSELPARTSPGSPENRRDWEGWGKVEQQIRQLKDEHRARLAQPTPYYPPPHNPVKRVQLAPDAPPSPTRPGPFPPSTSSSTSRISIANII